MIGRVATHNTPRVQTLIHLLRSVPGRIIAGSLPPSSSVTGVKFFTASAAICDMDNQTINHVKIQWFTHNSAHKLRTNESDMFNQRGMNQDICLLREAAYDLNQLLAMSAGFKTCFDRVYEPCS